MDEGQRAWGKVWKRKETHASTGHEEVHLGAEEVGNMPTFVGSGPGADTRIEGCQKVFPFPPSRSSLGGCEGGPLLTVTLSPGAS